MGLFAHDQPRDDVRAADYRDRARRGRRLGALHGSGDPRHIVQRPGCRRAPDQAHGLHAAHHARRDPELPRLPRDARQGSRPRPERRHRSQAPAIRAEVPIMDRQGDTRLHQGGPARARQALHQVSFGPDPEKRRGPLRRQDAFAFDGVRPVARSWHGPLRARCGNRTRQQFAQGARFVRLEDTQAYRDRLLRSQTAAAGRPAAHLHVDRRERAVFRYVRVYQLQRDGRSQPLVRHRQAQVVPAGLRARVQSPLPALPQTLHHAADV